MASLSFLCDLGQLKNWSGVVKGVVWKSILKEESLMAATGFLRWDAYQAPEHDDR